MNAVDYSPRRIIGLAIPMSGEQFLVFGVALFDTALVGRLGSEALSAQAVVSQWVQFTSVIFSVMAVGSAILIAQRVGQRDETGANDVLTGSLALALGSGLAAALVVLLAGSALLSMMGVTNAARQLGEPYFRLMALSFPLNFLLLTAGGCIRGAGDARTPLAVIGAANAVHVVCALILVFGVGTRTPLGLPGIGWATMISRGSGALLVLGLLARGVAGLHLRARRPVPDAMRAVWAVGRAVGGEQLALRLGQLVSLRLVTGLGTTAVAAYVVVVNSLSLILLIGIGFMNATLTIVGQQVGAGEGRQVYRTGWQVAYLAWLVMGGLALAFFVWPDVARLFSSDIAVLALAASGLHVVLFGVPFEVVNQVFTGGLRGVGDTRYPMWITALGHWLIRLPLIVLLEGTLHLGLTSVWLAMVTEMAVRSVLNVLRFRTGFWLQVQPEVSRA